MHGIKLLVPSRRATMYLGYTNGDAGVSLYTIIFWDNEANCMVPSDEKFYRCESMLQLPFSVENQHECLHTFCDGTLNPITGLNSTESVGSAYYNANENTVFQTIYLKGGRRIKMPSSLSDFSDYGIKVSAVTTGSTGSALLKDTDGTQLVALDYSANFDMSLWASRRYISATTTASGYVHKPWGTYNKRGTYGPKIISSNVPMHIIEIGTFSPSDFTTDISSVKRYLGEMKIPSHALPENLTDRIYDQLIIPNVNNIENAMSIKGVKDLLPKLRSIIRKHNIKSLAEFYLIWKYEVNTTRMDFEAYIAYFHALAVQSGKELQTIHLTCTSKQGISSSSSHYTISLPTYNSSFLESCGLTISSPNVWDTLPASFIVDWFIGIGDVLQRLHADNVIVSLPINYCTISTSAAQQDCILEGPFKGSVVRKGVYYRTTSKTIPTPDIDVAFKNPIRHIFDGSALFIASRR